MAGRSALVARLSFTAGWGTTVIVSGGRFGRVLCDVWR